MANIYYDQTPLNAQVGDTWWDTSVSPSIQKQCTNISPLTFVLVGQQKTTITRVVPTTGQTVTIPNTLGDQVIVIAPATDLAALTIAWPTTPYDGQAIRILCTKNVTAVSHSGGTLNRSVASIPATGDMNFVYDLGGTTYMCDGVTLSTIVSLPFTATTASGAGNAVFFPTSDGTSTGTALFSSFQDINVKIQSADPNIAIALPVVSNSNKTITINVQKQTFNIISLLSTNLLGSATLGNAPNGVVLTVLIHGVLA